VHLSYEEFESEMEVILNDQSKIYQSQVREIYTLGTFLAVKKYRFVRLAYISFILGLLLSGIVSLILAILL